MAITLSISWDLEEAWPKAQTWHHWQERTYPPNPLESRLKWAPGTIAFIDEALSLRLPRYTGWDGSELGDSRKAMLTASQYYKRGVPSLPGKSEPFIRKGSYPIEIFNDAALAFLSKKGVHNYFVVVDEGVAHCWPQLRELPEIVIHKIHESTKTLATVGELIAKASSIAPDKPWFIIGGGVLADTAAFAAALLGRSFTLVPTTLLSMVDACVGGKTGVNFSPYGKNLVGCFAFPDRVLVCLDFLRTLSPRDMQGGRAECVKHALLEDDPWVYDAMMASREFDSNLVAKLIKVKAKTVAQDPNETGQRAILNFGHTLAHALEAVSHERVAPKEILSHGEAVGVGLGYALLLSHKAGFLPESELKKGRDLLDATQCLLPRDELERRLGFKLADSGLWDQLSGHFAQDKKAGSGESRWVLLKKVGETVRETPERWTVPVSQKLLTDTWRTFIALYT